jgi:hypothetical protein
MNYLIIFFLFHLSEIKCFNQSNLPLSNDHICQVDSFLDGDWVFLEEESLLNAWDMCPLTKSMIAHHAHNGVNHVISYNCSLPELNYLEAKFIYNYNYTNCSFWNYKKSVEYISNQIFNKRGNKAINIHHVGDSLGGIYAVASGCLREINNVTDFVKVSIQHDISLRNDIPCSNSCFSKHKDYKSSVFVASCSKCNSTFQHVAFDSLSPNFFINNVPIETNILILNAGSWYNELKLGENNSESIYEETLHLLAPILNNLIHRGMIVVWIELPYRPNDIMNSTNPKYDWNSYFVKDVHAKKHFE